MAEPSDRKQPPSGRPPVRLNEVGDTLRRAYDEVATEPLPETFEELLRQLG